MEKKKKEKKNWYVILAPELFNKAEVGETVAKTQKHLINRKVEIPLSDLTNNINDIYSYLVFRITDVDGNKAYTSLDGFYIPQPFVKSLARKRREVIKVIKDCQAKDTKLRMKIVAVTPKLSKAQESSIRKEVEKMIEEFTKDKSFDEVIDSTIKKEFFKPIIEKIKKIAPIQKFEVFKIEKIKQ
jgi:small subunit ribosomal protein S3Ae